MFKRAEPNDAPQTAHERQAKAAKELLAKRRAAAVALDLTQQQLLAANAHATLALYELLRERAVDLNAREE